MSIEQFVIMILSAGGVQLLIAIASAGALRQQIVDLVIAVKTLTEDVKGIQRLQTDHEGRLSHVEGRLQVPRD